MNDKLQQELKERGLRDLSRLRKKGTETKVLKHRDRPDRERMADIIFSFRWFFSNNRNDALDLADQLLALYPDEEEMPA